MPTSVKKYTHIHPDDHFASFRINRMEAIYDQMGGKTDDPHRHEYYTIAIVEQAKGQHLIDFHAFTLEGKQIYFISPGQVHQVIEEEKSYGWILTFTQQFMVENGIEACFIEDLHLFQDYGFSPPLEVNQEEWEELNSIAMRMQTFYHSNKKFQYQAIGALLKLCLIECNNICALPPMNHPQSTQAALSLLRSFKDLLHKNFREWHKVGQYAEALHITPDYLNVSVKSLTGKSAKEHIQSRITVAAKRLLRFSALHTKEISYELGFSEPANFSQFFKKCVGVSPSKFRKGKNLKTIS